MKETLEQISVAALATTSKAGRQRDHVWARSSDLTVLNPRGLHPTLQVGNRSDNALIVGDAFDALTSLATLEPYRQRYRQAVKLCYIDPPFNTGENFEHYRDHLDSEIWSTTFRERLERARNLLSPDGSVWVHLDDSEQHRARCVMDEIFGREAFVATVIWQKRTSRDNRKAFSSMHDYIHVYAPAGPVAWKKQRNALQDHGLFWNPDNDPRGPWRSVPMTAQAGHATADQFYSVVSPAGVVHNPPAGRCWTYSRRRLEQLIADDRVYWPKGGRGKPRLKRYQTEASGLAPFTIWTADEVGENAHAKKALLAAFPDSPPFDTPKPERLMERIIQIATNPGDLVLDYYLGSGTTAVVAIRLGRRWVGVENSPDIVTRFALPRITAAVEEQVISATESRVSGGFAVIEVAASARPNGRGAQT